MADREAKAASKTAPIGLSWGNSASGPSNTLEAGAREHDVKGVFGRVVSKMPAPPPAGGASRPPGNTPKDAVDLLFSSLRPDSAEVAAAPHFEAVEDGEPDPMASLFSAGAAVPAPKLDPQSPSQSPPPMEPRRWQHAPAGTRTSLFDDHVRDPAPPARSPQPPSAPPPSGAVLGAIDLKPASRAAPPLALPSQAPGPGRAPTPPPPPAEARRSRKPGAESRAPQAEAAPPPARDPKPATGREAAPAARKRRIVRGPSPLALGALAVGSVLALGTASVLLGLVRNPFGAAPTANAADVRAINAPSSVAAKVAPAAPITAPPAQPAARQTAAPRTAAPQAAAPKAAPEPANATAAPAPEAPKAAVPAAPPPKPKPAESAAAPLAVAAAAEPARTKTPAVAESGSDSDDGSSALLASARKKLADDDAKGAEAILRQALAHDPQDHHAMELLARALMEQERGQEALGYARKIVQRRPHRVSYRLLLGDLLLMVGNEAAARSEWTEASKLAPNDPQIKRRLGK